MPAELSLPAAIPMTDRDPDIRVLELDPTTVFTPEGNRQPTPDSVTDLLASMKEHGHLVLGIVAPHPTNPLWWLCLDGNRRLLCDRILGLKFRAVMHEGEISPAMLAITRIATNNIREKMTDIEVATDLQRIIDANGCSQAEAGRLAGLSAGEVSRIMTFPKRAIPELVAAVEARRICRDVGRIICRKLPPERQKEALDRAIQHDMKRDAVEAMCSQMAGGKRSSTVKAFKARVCGFVLASGDAPPEKLPDRLRDLHTKLGEALKQIEKDPRLIPALPQLLKS